MSGDLVKRCHWCKREGAWPAICANTRDMEDYAIDGNLDCLKALVTGNLGEKGARYVVLNYIEIAKRREAQAASRIEALEREVAHARDREAEKSEQYSCERAHSTRLSADLDVAREALDKALTACALRKFSMGDVVYDYGYQGPSVETLEAEASEALSRLSSKEGVE